MGWWCCRRAPGKTHVAVMGIDLWRRSTLVVAPTLDLVRQWYDLLRATFRVPVGVVGGGDHDVQPLTVTTYDSAYIHMEHLGNRFGMVVFDECHHLPGTTYALAAQLCLAPFRLGLTATPERDRRARGAPRGAHRPDGLPARHRGSERRLPGRLRDGRVVVELAPEERAEYEAERAIYRGFVRSRGIDMRSPSGWSQFIIQSLARRGGPPRDAGLPPATASSRSARRPSSTYVEHLLHRHRKDRAILFTQDNATCYEVVAPLPGAGDHPPDQGEGAQRHPRRPLATGVTARWSPRKVLNEGVDVPDANVAIVVSGSGSVREHVQRLGRVLRKKGDKRAILYELVTAETTETFTSQRRREHVAYR